MSATRTAPTSRGDLGKLGKVDHARVRGCPAKDQLWLVLARERSDFVEIDEVIVAAHTVLNRVEVLARDRDLPAVGQVTAARQPHAHDRVAGVTEGEVHGEVGG